MFIHFFNDQILKLKRKKASDKLLSEHLRNATIYICAFTDKTLKIPIVDLVQSKPLDLVRDFVFEMCQSGFIDFIGSSDQTDNLLRAKEKHFAHTGVHKIWLDHKAVSSRLTKFEGSFEKKISSTTSSMKRSWMSSILDVEKDSASSYGSRIITCSVEEFENLTKSKEFIALKKVPSRLEEKAFLLNVIENTNILDFSKLSIDRDSIEHYLAHLWLQSYMDDYGPYFVNSLAPLGQIDFGLAKLPGLMPINVQKIKKVLNWINIDQVLSNYLNTVSLIEVLNSNEFHWLRSKVIVPMYYDNYKLHQGIQEKISTSKRFVGMDRIRYVAEVFGSNVNTQPSYADNNMVIKMEESKKTIFIGHGRSRLWMELKDFLSERLGYSWEEFNRVPVAGVSITERLEQMLDSVDFAFLVLSAEDEHEDGSLHARENVIHEVGLFQGRLGFKKAIVLLEENCNEFSNINGLNQIRFPQDKISAIFEEIRKLLEERL